MPYIINGMRDLLAKGDNLPTLPTVVFQLHKVLDDENAGSADVAAIIERDPALTSRLLRAANSAAFSRGGDRLGSVNGAVTRLGVNQIRAICIALAVVKAFRAKLGGIDHHAFWVHSAAVGMLSRQIWNSVGEGSLTGDDLYVAGLLHDAGLLVLEQFFPREFGEVLDARAISGARLWQVEEEDLGMDHGAVGGLLLGRWSLPQALVEAVTNHHHPHQADEQFQSASRVVQAAEVLCTEHGAAMTEEGPADCSPEDVLTELGMDEEGIRRVMAEVPAIAVKAAQFLA